MKIALLEHPRTKPPERCNDIANAPLSSCLLTGYTASALLMEGHEVEVIEGHMEGLSYQQIGQRLREIGPDLLGVHMVYMWDKGNGEKEKSLAGFLSKMKKEGAAPFVAAYGYYPTFAAEQLLSSKTKSPFALDAVLLGEPELTFAALAARLALGRPIRGLPGIAMVEDGSLCFLSSPPIIAKDLDALAFPLRTEAMRRLPEVNLLGSRGCHGRCVFCHIPSFFGDGRPLWRGRSPENIVLEIDSIMAKDGARYFYFADPDFFGPGEIGQKRALKLAPMLGERGITFGFEARADHIKEKTIAALAKAGLRHILVGFESGSALALRRLRKMSSVAENEEAIKTLRRHGIEPNAGFIMFDPDSTLADIRDSFRFLKRNGLLHDLQVTANVLSHHQIVLRGTETFLALPHQKNYEGLPAFKDPLVHSLSVIMRKTAGLVFRRMDGIWSGRVTAPAGTEETCRRINDFLVGLFEENLQRFLLSPNDPGLVADADVTARSEEYLNRMFNRMMDDKVIGNNGFLGTWGRKPPHC